MSNTIHYMFQYRLSHIVELFYTCLHNRMSICVSCLLLLFNILNILSRSVTLTTWHPIRKS
jgi:hypothetical protein